jgi:hypothetical protein
VACDVALHLPDVSFPSAMPQVMRPERTFWEKATAIHVFSAQGSFRGGDRYARHWREVTRLGAAGFAESMPDGAPVDYRAAITGALDPAPSGDARKTLAEDCQRIAEDGLLLDDAEPFDVLLQRCQALALKANAAALGAA